MFASGSKCTLGGSSSLRFCVAVDRSKFHNFAVTCLTRAKLHWRRADAAFDGVCSCNGCCLGSNTDTWALLRSGNNVNSNSAKSSNNQHYRRASRSANSSISRRGSSSVSSTASNTATRPAEGSSTSHHVAPRSSSYYWDREADDNCKAKSVSVGPTSLSSLDYCHSCFTSSSRSCSSGCASGECIYWCRHGVGSSRKSSSTCVCRCSRSTPSTSSSSSERANSRSNHEAYSSCMVCGSNADGYSRYTTAECSQSPQLCSASVGLWRHSSDMRRARDAETAVTRKVIKSRNHSSRTQEKPQFQCAARNGSSQTVFRLISSCSAIVTGSRNLADTCPGEQTSSKVCKRSHLKHADAVLECSSVGRSERSNTKTSGKTFLGRRADSLIRSTFLRVALSRRKSGVAPDVSMLVRAPSVFSSSPHSPSLFHCSYFSCDSSYLLSSCPSSSLLSLAFSCSRPSSLVLPPCLCFFSSSFSFSLPISFSHFCLLPFASLHSFCFSPQLFSSLGSPSVSSSMFLSFERCLSTGGSGRRGYSFDPIADALETEPQAVAKLDELAMVQLKTVMLPVDLRQRLEQLLRHAGRKQDIEKVGKMLMAKYTARTSVELPRILPSQLFATVAAGARSFEDQGEDQATALPVDPEREEVIKTKEQGLPLSEEARLQQEAVALAEDQRHRLFRKLAGSHSPLTAAAYTAHRYAGVYSSMLRILQEIKLRAPDFRPEHVLEMHAGFAAGLAAAARVWTGQSTDSRSSSAPSEEEIASPRTAERRDDSCGSNCPVAAWWAAATGTASMHVPAGVKGSLASSASASTQDCSPMKERYQQQEHTIADSSVGHRQQVKGNKSVFKFLLAVERSSHLMTVGKFLTADLYPPVQWQMGLYEEGLGIFNGMEKAAGLTTRKEENNRPEAPQAFSGAGPLGEEANVSPSGRVESVSTRYEAAADTLKDRWAGCPSSSWPQSQNCSLPDSDDTELEQTQRRRRRFDLIMLPHCLLSTADGLESIQQQVRSLWNRVAHGGILVLLERGTPTGFRALHSIREMFIKELAVGKFHFVAPCPHESICPLALTGRDWCHFSQRVHRLPHHLYCKGSRAKNVEEEKFSFLVIRKMPGPRNRYTCEAECRTPEERSYFWPRLVMPVIKGGQHCLLDLCAAPHSFERVAVSKSMPHTAGYKCARKAHWGDLWRYPRRIIRPDARGYTDEQIRKHLLRLHRKTQQRVGSSETTRCDTHSPAAAAEDALDTELKASFGG